MNAKYGVYTELYANTASVKYWQYVWQMFLKPRYAAIIEQNQNLLHEQCWLSKGW